MNFIYSLLLPCLLVLFCVVRATFHLQSNNKFEVHTLSGTYGRFFNYRNVEFWSDNKIVGGDVADIKDYPFAVCLVKKAFDFWTKFIGGAVIISPHWALTVAHNMHGINKRDIKMRTICIRGGSSYWEQNYNEHYVMKAIVHNQYHKLKIDYDIALLKVETAFNANYEKPIPLAEQDYEYIDGSEVTVLGWGTTDPDNIKSSDELRYATINIVGEDTCKNSYKNLKHNRTITNRMICAGAPRKHSCVFDSGGPLIQRGTLIGLVSWGPLPCVHSKRPGVYTRVSYFNKWIRQHTNTSGFNVNFV